MKNNHENTSVVQHDCLYNAASETLLDEEYSSLEKYIRAYNSRYLLTLSNWTDICDGNVDRLNNGVDEEHCWQPKINVCQDDEYRCYDGLCVPKHFLRPEAL